MRKSNKQPATPGSYTPWSNKKQDTKLLSITLPNNDRFSKFFHCYTQQEICNKDIITDPATSSWRRYTTLRNISLQKLHRLKAQQRQTRHAHSEENVTDCDR